METQGYGIGPVFAGADENRDVLEDHHAFRKAITKLRGRKQVLLLVQRGRNRYYVTLELA